MKTNITFSIKIQSHLTIFTCYVWQLFTPRCITPQGREHATRAFPACPGSVGRLPHLHGDREDALHGQPLPGTTGLPHLGGLAYHMYGVFYTVMSTLLTVGPVVIINNCIWFKNNFYYNRFSEILTLYRPSFCGTVLCPRFWLFSCLTKQSCLSMLCFLFADPGCVVPAGVVEPPGRVCTPLRRGTRRLWARTRGSDSHPVLHPRPSPHKRLPYLQQTRAGFVCHGFMDSFMNFLFYCWDFSHF